MRNTACWFVVFLMCGVVCLAADGPTTGPSPDDFKGSLAAREAAAQYQSELRLAQEEYQAAQKAADVKYQQKDDMRYLKLARSPDQYVIIAMDKAHLFSRTEISAHTGWQGMGKVNYAGAHLGVFNKDWSVTHTGPAGAIVVSGPAEMDLHKGWGFGRRHCVNDHQGFTWAGEPIEPTVFEISVTAGGLSAEEQKSLLP